MCLTLHLGLHIGMGQMQRALDRRAERLSGLPKRRLYLYVGIRLVVNSMHIDWLPVDFWWVFDSLPRTGAWGWLPLFRLIYKH